MTSEETTLPPQDLEAERALLAALLRDLREAWPGVREAGLDPGDFYNDLHREVFRRLAYFAWRDKEADPVLLTDWIVRGMAGKGLSGRWDRDDVFHTLLDLVDMPAVPSNAGYYAGRVRTAGARRRLAHSSKMLGDLAGTADQATLHQLVEQLTDSYQVLHGQGTARGLPVTSASDFLAADMGSRPLLVGPQVWGRGEWLTVAGEEKAGKSLLALDLAGALVADEERKPNWCGFPVYGPCRVLYLVGEGGELSFYQRLAKRLHGYSKAERDRLGLWFPSPTLLSLNDQREYMDLRNYVLDHGIEAVILDPLAHFHSLDENATADMKLVAGRLIELKQDTGTAIMAVHHTRKAQPNSKKGSPREGRGSTVLSGANDGTLVFERTGSDQDDPDRRIYFTIRNAAEPIDAVDVQLDRASLRYQVLHRDKGGRPADHGVSRVDVLKRMVAMGTAQTYRALYEAHPEVPERTMQRWIGSLVKEGYLLREQEAPTKPVRFRPPPSSLTGQQLDLIDNPKEEA